MSVELHEQGPSAIRQQHIKCCSNGGGFTLIELAIVLMVVGLLLVGLLGPLRTQIEARDRQKNQDNLSEIREALYGYAITKGWLPCPDSTSPSDGVEDRNVNGSCANVQGVLPWVTLGINGQDAWGKNYIYRVAAVSSHFTDSLPNTPAYVATSPCTEPAQSSFDLCDNGDIQILDASGGTVVANQIPAVVISLGANKVPGVAPASNDEKENDLTPAQSVVMRYLSVLDIEVPSDRNLMIN